MPAPRPHTQGMTNQYSTSSAPTLRLLCSISGTIKIVHLYLKKQIWFVTEKLLTDSDHGYHQISIKIEINQVKQKTTTIRRIILL